ncbi:hypothetical protein J6590_003081 [Homalodisca vitripennis]|nr:hypothetical protein J6590_003081 [Homalodisca vitripennis]
MIYVKGEVTESLLPRFAEPIPNVTVTIGRDALLACVVDNLRSYKFTLGGVNTPPALSPSIPTTARPSPACSIP